MREWVRERWMEEWMSGGTEGSVMEMTNSTTIHS